MGALIDVPALICFSSNLHVTGFSSCRITQMIHSNLVWFLWWLRHGAIGPNEATLVGVNVDWLEFWIYTFEFVIRLSKVQQLALPFCTFSERSCLSGCPLRSLWNSFLLSEVAPNIQKPLILQQVLQLHCIMSWHKNQAGTRLAGVVFFWFSGEVKHIVHLIRWNLSAVVG